MNGSEFVMRALAANGVTVCFMNPGTSEMRFVAALDEIPEIRGVLCLFEGVCAGAADGYARVTGRTGCALFHLGPGLANGLANLHNARKARSPVIALVGEHTTSHLKFDAPLSADIAAFARAVSDSVQSVGTCGELSFAVERTIADASRPPGQVAAIIVPADISWSPVAGEIPRVAAPVRAVSEDSRIAAAADLARGPGAWILLGGTAVNPRALRSAAAIEQGTGARVAIARNVPKIASGRGLFQPPQVPYFPEKALEFFAGAENLILVESEIPVSFFGYPGVPGCMIPESCETFQLARRDEDGTAALEALAARCGALNSEIRISDPAQLELRPSGALTLDDIGAALATMMPEGAIVSEEAVSSAAVLVKHLRSAAPFEWMPVTGGSIGQGLPVAVGAAIACPDRKVIALEGDGSGMYTAQALWTMARENLDVLIIIIANRRYAILDIEMRRAGVSEMGPRADAMIDISRPELKWTSIARSMGVDGVRAETVEEFRTQLCASLKERGPKLIEAVV
jgi:acetolactate synthase-1/2/3 large subunit